jgi:hypothetical protein
VPELASCEKWQLACEATHCTAATSPHEDDFALSPVCGSAFADTASESSYYDAHDHDTSQMLPETAADELDTAMAALHLTAASPIALTAASPIAAAAVAATAVAVAAATPARSPSSSPCITKKKRGKKQRIIESSDSDSNHDSDENSFAHAGSLSLLNSSKKSSNSAKLSTSLSKHSPKRTLQAAAAVYELDTDSGADDDSHDVYSDVVDRTEAAAAAFSSGSECSFEDIERTRLDISISDDSDSECSNHDQKRTSKHSKSPYIKGKCRAKLVKVTVLVRTFSSMMYAASKLKVSACSMAADP